jgi:dihydrolipoamide dehydrogenase
VENTGVEVDERGFIKVNENFQTSMPNIWAFGDAIGKAMYKHVANKEAELVWHGFAHGHVHSLDYDKVPYAVFGWPQIASVGMTEAEAAARDHDLLIGTYNYADTAKGAAMAEEEGFVKVIMEDKTYRILGAHVIGPYAPILIQEIINVMHAGNGEIYPLSDAMHIHPALPEVIQRAFYNLHKPKHNP